MTLRYKKMDIEEIFVSNERISGYFHKDLDYALRNILCKDPQALFESSIRDFKREKRSRVSLIEFSGKRYVVKHYYVKSFFYRIRRSVMPSRARTVWKKARAMKRRQISTPSLLSAVDEGKGFSYGGTTCLYEYVAPDRRNDELKKDFTDQEKRKRIIFFLASLVARMHNSGIYHGDAKISNFLWVERAGKVDIHVIDFEDCRVIERISLRQRLSDMANLVFSFAWWDNYPGLGADCFRVYLNYDASWCRNQAGFLRRLSKRVAEKLEHRRIRQRN